MVNKKSLFIWCLYWPFSFSCGVSWHAIFWIKSIFFVNLAMGRTFFRCRLVNATRNLVTLEIIILFNIRLKKDENQVCMTCHKVILNICHSLYPKSFSCWCNTLKPSRIQLPTGYHHIFKYNSKLHVMSFWRFDELKKRSIKDAFHSSRLWVMIVLNFLKAWTIV